LVDEEAGSTFAATISGIEGYRVLLAMACADGWLTSKEDQRLGQARRKYGITIYQHEQLLAEITGVANVKARNSSPASGVSNYRSLLDMACADGWLTSEEDSRLREGRIKYGVSMQQHEQLLAEVTGRHRPAMMSVHSDSASPRRVGLDSYHERATKRGQQQHEDVFDTCGAYITEKGCTVM
jgi:hypothetical protein